jgi:membrane protein involved in D-alanine export
MGFYEQPAFFALAAVSIIPAAILGVCGKRIKYYGFAASIVFILLLFSTNLPGLGYLTLFVVVSACVNFLYAHYIKGGGTSKWIYLFGFVLIIAQLVIYKVSSAFSNSLLGFLGMSYITFKSVQTYLEIHDGIIKDMTLLDYLYFVLFFPPFTSGPIDRSRRFIEDANHTFKRDEYLKLLNRGILMFLLGVLYKEVFGAYFSMINSWGGTGFWEMTRTAWSYGGYLFFDFAGYSFMAIGLSYCFGIHTPRNFRAPFIAIDIKDFWNRWHITLSYWLRDFVFMRFTRESIKHKWFKSRTTTACVGYIVNMTLMGAWHGLTPYYLLYGIFHGVLLAATELWQKKSRFYKRHKNALWYKAVSWFITLNMVIFSFSLFTGQATSFFMSNIWTPFFGG